MWGIMYYVEKGITGFRRSWLKDKDVVYETESFDEADIRALQLTREANDISKRQTMSPRATFKYEATER